MMKKIVKVGLIATIMSSILYADVDWRDDEKAILERIESKEFVLDKSDNIYKQDLSFLEEISPKLKKDKNFIIDCLGVVDIFIFMDKSLKKDKEFIHRLMNNAMYPQIILSQVDESIRNDKSFILSHIKRYPYTLSGVGDKLLNDSSFITEVLESTGYGLIYATEEQKKNKKLVLKAVKFAGNQLEFADKSLTKDREIVEIAVKGNGYALKFADKEFKKDKKIVLMAVEDMLSYDYYYNQYVALEYADRTLINDKAFILEVLKINPDIFEYIAYKFKKDKDILDLMKKRK